MLMSGCLENEREMKSIHIHIQDGVSYTQWHLHFMLCADDGHSMLHNPRFGPHLTISPWCQSLQDRSLLSSSWSAGGHCMRVWPMADIFALHAGFKPPYTGMPPADFQIPTSCRMHKINSCTCASLLHVSNARQPSRPMCQTRPPAQVKKVTNV